MALREKLFDLQKLYNLFALVASLKIEMEIWALLSPEIQYLNMMERLGRIISPLKAAGLSDSETWLESHLDLYERNREEGDAYPAWSIWQQFVMDGLERKIQTEISNLSVVLQTHKNLEPEKIIDLAIFKLLPRIAKQDLMDALDCFSMGLYTAGAILAWRSSEATLREYYRRLTGSTCLDSPTCTWTYFLKELRTGRDSGRISFPSQIEELLENGHQQRNKLAHPILRFSVEELGEDEKELAQEAWQIIKKAVELSSELIHELIEQKRKLAVGQKAFSHRKMLDLYPDIILARVILDRDGGGIGRLEYLDNENYDIHDLNHVLGMETGDFNVIVSSEKNSTIAKMVADELLVTDKYNPLIQFVQRWRYEKREQPLISSSGQFPTIEDLLETLPEMYPDGFDNRAFNLFVAIQKENERRLVNHRPPLDLEDPNFIYSFSTITDGFEDIVQRAEKRMILQKEVLTHDDPAWENRIDVEYNGLRTVIIAASGEVSIATDFVLQPNETILNRSWKNGYQLILYTDLEENLWVRCHRGVRVEWGPLYRRLKQEIVGNSAGKITRLRLAVGFEISDHSFQIEWLKTVLKEMNETFSEQPISEILEFVGSE